MWVGAARCEDIISSFWSSLAHFDLDDCMRNAMSMCSSQLKQMHGREFGTIQSQLRSKQL